MKLRLVILALLTVGCAAACGESRTSPYPTEGPEYVAGGLTTFPVSAEALIREADLVAMVKPTGERLDVWLPPEISVSARFPATVGHVFKGSVNEGDSILLFAPGGEVKDPFVATESRRPDGASRSVVQEYVDWPFFYKGAEELVFLKLVTPEAGSGLAPFYYNLGPLTRYSLKDGKLRSILAASIDVYDQGNIRGTIEGKDLEWLEAEVARMK
jgi:hypothetical protein